tara:strand:+ start:763 stop:1359 length:597 start_codon:yes stop_codon:yes gene_type:complete
VDEEVPRWLRDTGKGWVTAEYSMLPGSSPERVRRKNSGRSQEIQRLIGRSLRAAVDLSAIPELQVTVDCDVIQADGGTRTASICGGFVALHDAFTRMILKGQMENHPMSEELAAVSVGVIRGEVCLDLPYVEDSTAEVDLNVVMTGSGKFVEVQGTAEDGPFDRNSLEEMLDVAESGIKEITEAQRELLSSPPGERAS